jgi:hypothetical protein
MASEKTYYQLGKERLLAELRGYDCELCYKHWPPEVMRVVKPGTADIIHGLYNLSKDTLVARLSGNHVICLNCLKGRKNALDG